MYDAGGIYLGRLCQQPFYDFRKGIIGLKRHIHNPDRGENSPGDGKEDLVSQGMQGSGA